jgi:uncharacterized protein DUF6982
MPQNKIVVHYLDGRIIKGDTVDFLPTRPNFHLMLADASPPTKPMEVRVADLKAIFFVKDLAGSPQRRPRRQEFAPGQAVLGRKIRVVFTDGEILVGTTQGYDSKRPGFFVFPADTDANNDRIFVLQGATREVAFI